MPTATARKNGRFGFKAVVIHDGIKQRTEVLGTQHVFNMHTHTVDLYRAAPNFATREEAVDYARRTIAHREREGAIANWLFNNRDENGIRRTRDEAIAALGLTP